MFRTNPFETIYKGVLVGLVMIRVTMLMYGVTGVDWMNGVVGFIAAVTAMAGIVTVVLYDQL